MLISITEKQNCCGCGACANICPTQCISMTEDAEGFLYPAVDASRCVDCGMCGSVCVFQRAEPLRQKEPACYAAIAKDNAVRLASSSGGVFSLLAESVIASDGVVYGVAMDENMRGCSCIRVTCSSELPKLRGSKYLQADVRDAYRSVKRDLETGRRVLFSGVPCQIDGLKLFLSRDYSNLYCVEVVCHGTPSPLLWRTYLDFLEKKHRDIIRSVQFRNKASGWRKYGLALDGETLHQNQTVSDDPYLRMFSRDYALRPSCYQCRAKALESCADLTLGDFWGIWNLEPDMHDDQGTSMVLVQSDRGAELFESIRGSLACREMPFADSIAFNAAYCKSAERPKERDTFFADLQSIPFEEMIRKYCALSVKARIKKTALYQAFRKALS